jgi:penicillin-binding protein 1A
MGENLPLFAYGEGESGGDQGTTVTNSAGKTVVVPKKADFGTVSSGGLY